MKTHTFEAATELLLLTDEEINQIYVIRDRELARQEAEDDKIARSQTIQLEALMKNPAAASKENFSSILADSLYVDLEEPATYHFSRNDLYKAQSFLRNINLLEYASRLWRYHGVALNPIISFVRTSGRPPTSGPPMVFVPVEAQQQEQDLKMQHIQADDPADRDFQIGESPRDKNQTGKKPIKYKASGRYAPGSRKKKRPPAASRVLKLKVLSGLRNSISADNLEVAVATAPAALQPACSPGNQAARLPQKSRPQTLTTKTPPTRLQTKSSMENNYPSTPVEQIRTTIIASPSLVTKETKTVPLPEKHQVSTWLENRATPYLPIQACTKATPSPQETPSRPPQPLQPRRRTMNAADVRLSRIESVLGKTETPVKGTNNKAKPVENGPRAPPMGTPPKILAEKTRSALRKSQAGQISTASELTITAPVAIGTCLLQKSGSRSRSTSSTQPQKPSSFATEKAATEAHKPAANVSRRRNNHVRDN
jgi:hypothetical protein